MCTVLDASRVRRLALAHADAAEHFRNASTAYLAGDIPAARAHEADARAALANVHLDAPTLPHFAFPADVGSVVTTNRGL